MKPLGPNEGMNALRHPGCRFRDEYQRLMRGEAEKNRQLRQKLAKLVRAELQADDVLKALGAYIDGANSEIPRAFSQHERVWEQAVEEIKRALKGAARSRKAEL